MVHECMERFTTAACYWSNVPLDRKVIWGGEGLLKVLNARMSAAYSDSCLRDNHIKPLLGHIYIVFVVFYFLFTILRLSCRSR